MNTSVSEQRRRLALTETLLRQGVPEWQIDMVLGEGDGMRDVIADGRRPNPSMTRGGMIPRAEPTPRERTQLEAQMEAQREREAQRGPTPVPPAVEARLRLQRGQW